MNPIEPWTGYVATRAEREEAAEALRRLSPSGYYETFGWNLEDVGALDSLEEGLFTKTCLVAGIGNVAALEDLIRRGTDVTKRSQANFTPLHAAVRFQHLGAVGCLLGTAMGRELATSTCIGGLTPLMLACDRLVPLTIAQALLPLSDLDAVDDEARSVRERAMQNGRGDIVTLLDLTPRNQALNGAAHRVPPPLPDTVAVVDTFREVARDFPSLQNRLDIEGLSQMRRCWQDLLVAHRQTVRGGGQGEPNTLCAMHAMKALRIRLLQSPPLAPVSWLDRGEGQQAGAPRLLPDIEQAHEKLLREARLWGERQADDKSDDASQLPVSVSLVPIHFLLVALRRELEQGIIEPTDAASSLTQAIDQGERILAQKRGFTSSLGHQSTTTYSLPGLRSRFESLKQQIEASDAARQHLFDAEPASAMLRVIAALEAKENLPKEQLESFCRQLQHHHSELEAAFREIKR